MHSEIISTILITAACLATVSTLLVKAKIPTIVGFVLTGVFIGPSCLHWVKSLPAANTIAELGVVFLMFSIGLELSLSQLKKTLRPLFFLGFSQVTLTILAAALFLILVVGLEPKKAFIFGALLSLSSTAIVFKLLQEERETESPHGRASILVLLFQDLAVLPMIIIIPFLASSSEGTTLFIEFSTTIGKFLLFLGACFTAHIFILPHIFSAVVKAKSREVFFFLILSLTLLVALLAQECGLSMSIGAFVAGALIADSPYSKQAYAELSLLRDIFLGFFFASLGMMLDLKFVWQNIYNLSILVASLAIIKFCVSYFSLRINKQSHGTSFASALALNQIGEFSFVIAATAISRGLITESDFQYFLSLAVLSLISSPPLFHFAIRSSAHGTWPELAKSLTLSLKNKTHLKDAPIINESTAIIDDNIVNPRLAIIIGLGHTGQKVLDSLHQHGIPCLGIDLNPELLAKVNKKGIAAIYGDATRPDILEAAGIHRAFLIVITVNGKQLTSQILSVAHQLTNTARVIVRVGYLAELDSLKTKQEDIVVVAETETARTLQVKALNCYDLHDED
jgi:monovalent cation:H+ antiporter-2, CPA2 family